MNSKKIIGSAITAVVVIIGGVAAFASGIFGSNSSQQTPTTTQPTPTPTPTPAPTPKPTAKYTNGTYSTTGSYRSPGGQEQFGLSVTIKNDVITSATFTPNPTDKMSARLQSQFASGFKTQVVGKNIDSVSIGVINGASLTSAGFMDALQNIKQQAAS